jgi:hypothetical protein
LLTALPLPSLAALLLATLAGLVGLVLLTTLLTAALLTATLLATLALLLILAFFFHVAFLFEYLTSGQYSGAIIRSGQPAQIDATLYDPGMDRLAPLFILGLVCALIGWAMVHIAAGIERSRFKRHTAQYGEHAPRRDRRLWIRFLDRWLLL